MKFLLLLCVVSISVCYSYACTCLPTPPNGCGSDYSIKGCVLRVKKVGKTQAAQFIYTVAIKRVFKRSSSLKLRSGRIVQIKSAVSSAACGVSLKAKKTYVISGSAKGHIFRTNSCQFVREWNSIPHKQRKSLYCKKASGYGPRSRHHSFSWMRHHKGYGRRNRNRNRNRNYGRNHNGYKRRERRKGY
ncbi:uncharacterized protein LOC111106494 [Crassostrea virginica]|uniref:NTR domain-containing protein-like n=1 Tax=Crassostrea virginica TaxID=6565 RepID=A0A8B8B2P9_CRAVI|nr:NTR domain-containing protein-like [Crassostrea virginica]